MDTVSIITQQCATKKRPKVHLSRPAIARKIVAFQELINLNSNKKSIRQAADILEVSYSTMQSWREQQKPQGLEDFLSTPAGADFLQRNTMAVMKLMKCGPGGICGMQEYLRNSGLDKHVASSAGALQKFWVRCEEYIVEFAEREETRLAPGMRRKKITAALDEMFRGKHPCLVAIEVVANFILLEKFTEDRTANTWKKELEPRLQNLNIELGQVVSDLCGAIRLVTKDLRAQHISELFHAQYEISKATSAPLAAQKRYAEKALNEAEEEIKKIQEKPLRLGKEDSKKQQLEKECELEEAIKSRDILKVEFEKKVKRREEVKTAVKEMGKIHHPIDLKTGALQTAVEMENRFNEQFKIIHECAKEAKLSESSINRIEKAQRAFDAIVIYLKYFFVMYAAFVEGLRLSVEEVKFFNEVIYPLSYLKMVWRRFPKKEKQENEQLLRNLEAKFMEAPWPEELKKELMKKGQELAEEFQRSSSCVEGRNGVLSLNYHRFHRLNARTLKVLTIMHNFDVRRSDGTTAAERFFEAKHENLFESLVANVCIPGRPRKQYHDQEKRLNGWKKRLVA